MGYRGKVEERERARQLRSTGMTLADIATELGVAKSSVSTWVADVAIEPAPRRSGPRRPSRLHLDRLDDERAAQVWAAEVIGTASERDLLIAGIALYAGEGAKTQGEVRFTNSDPRMVKLFCHFLRTFFAIDESRMRCVLYLHAGLDLEQAMSHWSNVTGVPVVQFRKPYRAEANPSIRRSKHPNGCVSVGYCCTYSHRKLLALIDALLMWPDPFRGSSTGRAADC